MPTSGLPKYSRGFLWCRIRVSHLQRTFLVMALKRQLSQPLQGATPARKTPRLTLTIKTPPSPDPVSTGPTVVVSPYDDDPPTSPFRHFRNVPSTAENTLLGLNPAQLVERLENLAEEYARSVDEMGAEIDHLKREVSFARRRLEASPSFEERDAAGGQLAQSGETPAPIRLRRTH